MKKNTIYRTEAVQLAPDYVAFIEGNWEALFKVVLPTFEKLRKGQKVLTFFDGVYFLCKITSINHNDFRAVDGPVVRLGNGKETWRVDGDRYCFPIKERKIL